MRAKGENAQVLYFNSYSTDLYQQNGNYGFLGGFSIKETQKNNLHTYRLFCATMNNRIQVLVQSALK
jgi:hypothetical protein